MAAVANQIVELARPVDDRAIAAQVRAYLDAAYPDIDSLGSSAHSSKATARRDGRSLEEDIAYWESKEREARERLHEAEEALPGAIAAAQAALTDILSRAQSLSLERYALADGITALLAELDSSAPLPAGDDDESLSGDGRRPPTLLEDVEAKQALLARSEAALAWASVLERVLKQRDATLDPANHKPSPLTALSKFCDLNASVAEMQHTLPPGMALLDSLRSVRDETWERLKDALGKTLVDAAAALKWPLRVDYAAATTAQRRAFERAYTEMLYLQSEGDRLGLHANRSVEPAWASGEGLYPLQALAKPIALRFRYHFQGTRNTNRVDKPEWGFANIIDSVHEHQSFISDYLQPLTARAGYKGIDVTSEFTMLLFPILLGFLRTRIPHILSHPALLAHTVYQTVLFDDAVRQNGFNLARTSIYNTTGIVDWDGLTGVILREGDWFEQWLEGEKHFAEKSLNDIISSPDAWRISDGRDDDEADDSGIPATDSARQVRALIEQITDRYSPLPALEYRAAFLLRIQLPILSAYHARVAGSLDAFETLSSAFVRVVPGALGSRPGTDARLSGTQGLDRLIKAHVSADFLLSALRGWSDDVLFAEMSADLAVKSANSDSDEPFSPPSVFDPTFERYGALRARSEDMMVRIISNEVEADVKEHLTRKWDIGLDGSDGTTENGADSSLVAALTSFTSLISSLARQLSRPATTRVYRRVSAHLVNHFAQRAVFSGWSKFTAAGGRALAAEVDDWRQAAAQALYRVSPPIPSDAPWARLGAMAKVLSLPSSSETEGGAEDDVPTFAQAMAAAWGSPASLASLQERAGITELSADDLQAVLRRRVECWR